ncbi:MAG: hypothetical protein ACD_79C01200G0001, partial [uncultured bacterium]
MKIADIENSKYFGVAFYKTLFDISKTTFLNVLKIPVIMFGYVNSKMSPVDFRPMQGDLTQILLNALYNLTESLVRVSIVLLPLMIITVFSTLLHLPLIPFIIYGFVPAVKLLSGILIIQSPLLVILLSIPLVVNVIFTKVLKYILNNALNDFSIFIREVWIPIVKASLSAAYFLNVKFISEAYVKESGDKLNAIKYFGHKGAKIFNELKDKVEKNETISTQDFNRLENQLIDSLKNNYDAAVYLQNAIKEFISDLRNQKDETLDSILVKNQREIAVNLDRVNKVVSGKVMTSNQRLGAAELANNKVVKLIAGGGKTIMAAISAMTEITSNRKVVISSTTEELAEQNVRDVRDFFNALDVNVGLVRNFDQGSLYQDFLGYSEKDLNKFKWFIKEQIFKRSVYIPSNLGADFEAVLEALISNKIKALMGEKAFDYNDKAKLEEILYWALRRSKQLAYGSIQSTSEDNALLPFNAFVTYSGLGTITGDQNHDENNSMESDYLFIRDYNMVILDEQDYQTVDQEGTPSILNNTTKDDDPESLLYRKFTPQIQFVIDFQKRSLERKLIQLLSGDTSGLSEFESAYAGQINKIFKGWADNNKWVEKYDEINALSQTLEGKNGKKHKLFQLLETITKSLNEYNEAVTKIAGLKENLRQETEQNKKTALENEITLLENRIKSLPASINELNNQINEIRNDIAKIEQEIKDKTDGLWKEIAFALADAGSPQYALVQDACKIPKILGIEFGVSENILLHNIVALNMGSPSGSFFLKKLNESIPNISRPVEVFMVNAKPRGSVLPSKANVDFWFNIQSNMLFYIENENVIPTKTGDKVFQAIGLLPKDRVEDDKGLTEEAKLILERLRQSIPEIDLDGKEMAIQERWAVDYKGINNLLRSYLFFEEGSNYLIQEDTATLSNMFPNQNVTLIDKKTGRACEVNRKLGDSLHLALDAKEWANGNWKIPVAKLSETEAYRSNIGAIKRFRKFPGLSGTKDDEHIKKVMEQETEELIDNSRRVSLPERVFTNKESKYKGIVSDILSVRKANRPTVIFDEHMVVSESTDFSQVELTDENLYTTLINNDFTEFKIDKYFDTNSRKFSTVNKFSLIRDLWTKIKNGENVFIKLDASVLQEYPEFEELIVEIGAIPGLVILTTPVLARGTNISLDGPANSIAKIKKEFLSNKDDFIRELGANTETEINSLLKVFEDNAEVINSTSVTYADGSTDLGGLFIAGLSYGDSARTKEQEVARGGRLRTIAFHTLEKLGTSERTVKSIFGKDSIKIDISEFKVTGISFLEELTLLFKGNYRFGLIKDMSAFLEAFISDVSFENLSLEERNMLLSLINDNKSNEAINVILSYIDKDIEKLKQDNSLNISNLPFLSSFLIQMSIEQPEKIGKFVRGEVFWNGTNRTYVSMQDTEVLQEQVSDELSKFNRDYSEEITSAQNGELSGKALIKALDVFRSARSKINVNRIEMMERNKKINKAIDDLGQNKEKLQEIIRDGKGDDFPKALVMITETLITLSRNSLYDRQAEINKQVIIITNELKELNVLQKKVNETPELEQETGKEIQGRINLIQKHKNELERLKVLYENESKNGTLFEKLLLDLRANPELYKTNPEFLAKISVKWTEALSELEFLKKNIDMKVPKGSQIKPENLFLTETQSIYYDFLYSLVENYLSETEIIGVEKIQQNELTDAMFRKAEEVRASEENYWKKRSETYLTESENEALIQKQDIEEGYGKLDSQIISDVNAISRGEVLAEREEQLKTRKVFTQTKWGVAGLMGTYAFLNVGVAMANQLMDAVVEERRIQVAITDVQKQLQELREQAKRAELTEDQKARKLQLEGKLNELLTKLDQITLAKTVNGTVENFIKQIRALSRPSEFSKLPEELRNKIIKTINDTEKQKDSISKIFLIKELHQELFDFNNTQSFSQFLTGKEASKEFKANWYSMMENLSIITSLSNQFSKNEETIRISIRKSMLEETEKELTKPGLGEAEIKVLETKKEHILQMIKKAEDKIKELDKNAEQYKKQTQVLHNMGLLLELDSFKGKTDFKPDEVLYAFSGISGFLDENEINVIQTWKALEGKTDSRSENMKKNLEEKYKEISKKLVNN